MAEFTCLMDGKVCRFVIEDKVLFMQSENTGGHLIKIGRPMEMKRNILMDRNKMPAEFKDFVNAWDPDDIIKVSKMESDEEMIEDMKNDFRLFGHEILNG